MRDIDEPSSSPENDLLTTSPVLCLSGCSRRHVSVSDLPRSYWKFLRQSQYVNIFRDVVDLSLCHLHDQPYPPFLELFRQLLTDARQRIKHIYGILGDQSFEKTFIQYRICWPFREFLCVQFSVGQSWMITSTSQLAFLFMLVWRTLYVPAAWQFMWLPTCSRPCRSTGFLREDSRWIRSSAQSSTLRPTRFLWPR